MKTIPAEWVTMNRDESIVIFKKYGLDENQIINMVVKLFGAPKGSMIEFKTTPMQAFLNTELEIVYKGGRRFKKLEDAIRSLVAR